MPGTKRDISGGREFSYVSATEYTMQVFDRVNDSRFWKSFITCYGCNNTSEALYWDSLQVARGLAPEGVIWDNIKKKSVIVNGNDTVDARRYVGGEVAIKYIVNNPGDTRFVQSTNEKGEAYSNDPAHVLKGDKAVNPNYFVRYFSGENRSWNIGTTPSTGNYYGIYPHKRSVALSKFRDGYRDAIASQFGTRDAIIARSADDVLMIAEAYARKGDASNAIKYLNMVRKRAGYAAGENRSVHVDGGQAYKNNTYCSGKGGGYSSDGAIYSEQNTYFESNNLEGQEDAINATESKSAMLINSVDDIYNSAVDAPIYEALGVTNDADKLLCFILNERTRELIGESQRWEDLARTKTLNARWWAFNDGQSHGGAFDAAKHYYRPIPQSFLDGITNASGNSLSDSEKEAMQNPGY